MQKNIKKSRFLLDNLKKSRYNIVKERETKTKTKKLKTKKLKTAGLTTYEQVLAEIKTIEGIENPEEYAKPSRGNRHSNNHRFVWILLKNQLTYRLHGENGSQRNRGKVR